MSSYLARERFKDIEVEGLRDKLMNYRDILSEHCLRVENIYILEYYTKQLYILNELLNWYKTDKEILEAMFLIADKEYLEEKEEEEEINAEIIFSPMRNETFKILAKVYSEEI